MKSLDLAKFIEHTALKPDVRADDVKKLCNEASTHGFFGVCIAPYWVPFAKECLQGSSVKIVSVISFPHGNSTTKAKVFEAGQVIEAGASEVDMVLNVGALKSGDERSVADDIRAVAREVHRHKASLLKVIIETALLTQDEKIIASKVCEQSGADFVKTSTGFASAGATIEDVRLIRSSVGKSVQIKAAGGIRDYQTAVSMIEAGADRIGCSNSVAIVQMAPSQR